MPDQRNESSAATPSPGLAVLGAAWLVATFTAAAAWMSHFGWPHQKGSASTGACAVTAGLVAILGVLFIVVALIELVRRG